MKNCKPSNPLISPCKPFFSLSVLALSLFALCPPTMAGGTITYDDAKAATGVGLQTEPTWIWNSGYALFPGTEANPSASGNTVTINFDSSGGMTFNPENVYGGLRVAGDATGNQVFLQSGLVDSVYGGLSTDTGNATNNSVTITGGMVNSLVYGGYVYGDYDATGNANNNSVTINGTGIEVGDVYGGFSGTGNANNNNVIITGANLRISDIYGGSTYAWADTGDATGNSVTINGANVEVESVYGGWNDGAGITSNNVVTVGDWVKASYVYGGWSDYYGTGEVSNNRVSVGAAIIGGSVVGGATINSSGGATNENSVEITGAQVTGYVVGGNSYGSNANGNSVIMRGGSVGENIYGGWAEGDGATANSNSVTLLNTGVGALNTDVRRHVVGGLSETDGGQATSNSVSISGGTINLSVYGGETWGEDSLSANNTVLISDAIIKGYVTGGYSVKSDTDGNRLDGGGSSNNNTVILKNATVDKNVLGGDAGGAGSTSDGNAVNILGGIFKGNIYGGHNSSADGDATGNSVSLSGNVTLNADPTTGTYLVGGHVWGTGDAFTGNTLNLQTTNALTLRQLGNFENYNFVLPAFIGGGQPLITITGATATDITGAKVTMSGSVGGGTALHKGETITLISHTTGTPTSFLANGVRQGISLTYDFALSPISNALQASVSAVHLNPQTKALAEGRAAGSAFLNQGSDNAIQNINTALKATDGSNTGIASFGAVSGGSNRYNTGSHVNVDGVTLILGAATNKTLADNSSLLMSAFVEGGTGSYNSYNSFTNAASVNGKGNTDYIGIGALGRYTLPSKLYFDASIRTGRNKVDFNSSDLTSTTGENASYRSNAWYYGMHGGVGYELPLNNTSTLDLSGKLIWTHLGSDSVTVAGDPVRFYSSDSLRSRLGARYNYTLNNKVTAYAGAAWEYEFDGKAKATTYGYNIDAPSVRGGTGVGEIGISVKPEENSNMSFDLALQGYAGKREGATGSVALKYKF